MASKKKKKVKKKHVGKRRNPTEPEMYAEFMKALLDGVIHAVRLYDTRVNGQLQLEMDEEVNDGEEDE